MQGIIKHAPFCVKQMLDEIREMGGMIDHENIGHSLPGTAFWAVSDGCGSFHGSHQSGGDFKSAEGHGAFSDGIHVEDVLLPMYWRMA